MQNKLERLDIFIAEREARSDWPKFISRDQSMLLRRLLCECCDFPRSTLYQNPIIKNRLVALEAELRQRKLLTASVPESLDGGSAAPATDSELEQQMEALEMRLQLACESLQEAKAHLESFLPNEILKGLP